MSRCLLFLRLSVLLLALTIVACRGQESGRAESGSEPEIVSGLSSDETTPPVAAAASFVEETGQADPPRTRSFSFGDTLARLDDYEMEIRVSFQGEDESASPVSFDFLGRESAFASPPQTRLDLSTANAGGADQIEGMSLIWVGDLGYLFVPGIGCVSALAGEFEAEMSLPLDPRQMFGGLTGGLVSADAVVLDGAKTYEFLFNESSMVLPATGSWAVKGSLFVDHETERIRRASMIFDGHGDLLGDGRDLNGTYNIVIDVRGAQLSAADILPAACGDGILYPVTADAFNIAAIEDLLAYESQWSLGDIVDFYLSEMPRNGWQLSAEPEVFEDLAILNFKKGNAGLLISVDYDAGSDAVSVLISP